ncbi:MAG: hypothetical protein M3442_11965, partial [Chloroflexota bacterium]|nr:hypothetical protein [Chloroflexota bacterium]
VRQGVAAARRGASVFVSWTEGVAPPVLTQLVVTLVGFWLLSDAGASDPLARATGVLAGAAAAVAVLVLRRSGPLLEARALVAAARQRS